MRLSESLLDPFNRLRVVATRYLGAYSPPPPLIISLQHNVQSHHIFSVTTFRVIFHNLVFRSTISFQFGIQSHYLFSIWCAEPLFLPSFSIQSHYLFSILAFRVTISSQFWRLEPSSLFNLAFRVIIFSQFRRPKPLSLFSFSVQSHHLFSIWRLESSSLFSYDVQNRHIFSATTFRVVLHSLTFKATISSQFRRSKPPSLFTLAFRGIIPS